MDDSTIETIVQDFLQNLEQSQIEIPEDMVREMIVLSRKKQFDPNADQLVSGLKRILERYNVKSKV